MVIPEQQLQEATAVTGDGYHAERIRSFLSFWQYIYQSVGG
jgi:hypothetical protein